MEADAPLPGEPVRAAAGEEDPRGTLWLLVAAAARAVKPLCALFDYIMGKLAELQPGLRLDRLACVLLGWLREWWLAGERGGAAAG